MTDLTAADADESLGATVQRCELEIAALAGRLDAESLSRSSATREISSTVESQLLAVRSTIHGLAAMRAAVEKIGQEVTEVAHTGWATESQAAALDARVTTLTQSVESQLGGLESKLSRMQGTIDAMRAEIGAGHAASVPAADGAESASAERELQDGAAIRGELAALRVTVAEVRGELAQLGETLTRAERDGVEVRRDVEKALSGVRADVEGALGSVRAEVGDTRAAVTGVQGSVETLRDEVETIALLRADVTTTGGRLDDTARALNGMHGTIAGIGGDVRTLQDACDAVRREAAAARDAITAARDATDERLAGLRAESRTELAAVRDAMHEAIAALQVEMQEHRAVASGEVRDGSALLRGEIERVGAEMNGIRGEVEGLRGEVDGTVDVLRQSIAGTGASLVDASGSVAAVREDLGLLRGAVERTQGDARMLRDDLESVRRDVAQASHDGAPEGLPELVDAVERLRSGLARQDAIVDERITTSHRAAEALRAELMDMRGQMNEMIALIRDQPTTEDARRTGIVDILADALETLLAPVAMVQAVLGQVPAVLGKVPAVLEKVPAVLPEPVRSGAASLLRRFKRSSA